MTIVTTLGISAPPRMSSVTEEKSEEDSEEDGRPSSVLIAHFNVNNSNNNEEYVHTHAHTCRYSYPHSVQLT